MFGGFKTVEALQSMYPHQHDLYDSIKSIKDLSFFEVGAEKTMLSPHVIDYVNKNIEPSTKTQFMIIVGTYYSELLQKNYKVIGRANDAMMNLSTEDDLSSLKKTNTL